MSVEYWSGSTGLFRKASNWSQAATPVAGDELYAQSGNIVVNGGAIGSTAARTTIGLIGGTADSAPSLTLRNVTLTNVDISEAPPLYSGPFDGAPPGYYAPKYGVLRIAGTVTNNGGLIEGGRNSLGPAASLNVDLNAGATLINKGVLAAFPAGQLTIGGHGRSVENDGVINASGGKVTLATHLTGVGDTYTGAAAGGSLSGNVEIDAAVDAGQTFHISQGSLQLDRPHSFLGKVDLGPTQFGGTVRLEGLKAASWDAAGSSVEFLNHAGKVIDTLHFTAPQDATTLVVYVTPDAKYGTTINVVSAHPFGAPTGATILPYHAHTA